MEYEDNWYYVDETGAMLRNTWKEVENTDDDDDFEDTVWYYFQSSGKAYKEGKKTINGKNYIFDEDGKMLFGWIKKDGDSSYSMASKDDDSEEWGDCEYYAGEANDGALATSEWRQIRVYDPQPDKYKQSNDAGDYDYWFYFKSNSKKYMADEDEVEEGGFIEKTVGNAKYAFATDGHMLSEWTKESSSAADGAKYFSDPEVGARVTKGWFKVVPSYGVDEAKSEEYDNEEKWFYADSDGKLYKNAIKTVNGKKYLFNLQGEVLAGLRYIEYDEDGAIATTVEDSVETSRIFHLDNDDDTETKLDKYTTLDGECVADYFDADDDDRTDYINSKTGVYYFARPLDTDAVMKTGTCSITVDGDSYSFKFKSDGTNKGKGVNGRDGNYYYVNGRKITADSDQKFELYVADTDNNKVKALYGEALTANDLINNEATTTHSGWAVVSTSGTLVKSGTKKDGDDYKIKVANYLVTKITNADDSYWNIEIDEGDGHLYADGPYTTD